MANRHRLTPIPRKPITKGGAFQGKGLAITKGGPIHMNITKGGPLEGTGLVHPSGGGPVLTKYGTQNPWGTHPRQDPRYGVWPGYPKKNSAITKGGPITPRPGKPPYKPSAQPFLTASQQAALAAYDAKYTAGIQGEQRRMSDSTYDTSQQLAGASKQHDIQAAQSNELMAARGLFQSSIRDGDLNDIDATLTIRQNLLNTNLQRIITDGTAAISTAGYQYGIEHNLYNQLAVQNAQAQTPVLGGNPNSAITHTGPANPTNDINKPITHVGGGFGSPAPIPAPSNSVFTQHPIQDPRFGTWPGGNQNQNPNSRIKTGTFPRQPITPGSSGSSRPGVLS